MLSYIVGTNIKTYEIVLNQKQEDFSHKVYF